MGSTFELSKLLDTPEYEPLLRLGRSLHMDDVVTTYKTKTLIPQKIKNTPVINMREKVVLWVAPIRDTKKSNFFGNVTFAMDWKAIFENFGPNLYLIDQSIRKKKGHSRILLTSKTYCDLKKVDLDVSGSPIMKTDDTIQHVSKIDCQQDPGPHEVQIAIDTGLQGGRWFYENCDISPNNHSKVNQKSEDPEKRKNKYLQYKMYQCYKFNTAQGKPCPYKFTASEAEDELNIRCPGIKSKEKRKSMKATIPVSRYAKAFQLEDEIFDFSDSDDSDLDLSDLAIEEVIHYAFDYFASDLEFELFYSDDSDSDSSSSDSDDSI